ncbi:MULTISPECIES: hypothetical protein [Streptomyces]|uniref:Uncharacterized protein n=1 Tax=Streptomyces fimbriatus TaxID=68197 RepID=A0ABW0D669_STRFI
MAEGDGVANQDIRVWLEEAANPGDIGALRKWLEREKPIDELLRAGELQIQERQVRRRGTDETGAPMGLGMEIVLVVIGAAAGAIFNELLEQVKDAVKAWLANRRDVEDGEPPVGGVEPVNRDDG